MDTTRKAWMCMGTFLVLAASCGAQPGTEHAVAGRETRYRAPLEGFALRPPPGAQKTTQRIPAILAQWTRSAPESGETLWTLRVYRTTFRNRQADVRDYAQAVKETLKLRPDLQVDDLNFLNLGEVPAIQVTGKTKEKVVTDAMGINTKVPSTELRQVWFLRGPGEFLVLDFVTVGNRLEWTNRLWETLVSSVELFDPAVFLQEQEKRIQRAGVFLNRLTGEAIQHALPKTPRWFLVRKDDTSVGWLCMQGRPTRKKHVAGYEIRSWAMFQLPGQPVRLVRQMQFTDPNMSMGLWSGRIQLGSGEQSVLFVEDGLRQGRMILATWNDGRRMATERKDIPEMMFGMYLPRAVGTLLPALLDRTNPAGYTFSEYDRQINDFQVRTVMVVGPERIPRNGKLVEVVRITDQPTADAEPVTFWVDPDGKVLQTRSPDGLVSAAASEEDVLNVYPNARAVITRMNRTQPKKQSANQRRAAN